MQQNRIVPGIGCFAWNKDCSQIAVSPNSLEIWIFKTNGTTDISKWERIQVLREHLNLVSALDWNAERDLLLSVSTDRGALVWSFDNEVKQLRPNLAVFKETKANIDGKWNHRGDKFCVGAASGNVFIGSYSQANNFWIGQKLGSKKALHKSSVISVTFDPQSSRVCASASTDGSCFITSCYDKKIDVEAAGPFASVTTFGETLISLKTIGWVNFVSFSNLGSTLCYATHDCEINFVDVSQAAQKVKVKPDKVFYKGNPFLSGIFASESAMVCCGYDKVPYLFTLKNGKWVFSKILDSGIEKERQTQIVQGEFEKSQIFFKKSEMQRGVTVKLDEDVQMKEMDTKHSNYINGLKVYTRTAKGPAKICTSDINGYLNYWDLTNL